MLLQLLAFVPWFRPAGEPSAAVQRAILTCNITELMTLIAGRGAQCREHACRCQAAPDLTRNKVNSLCYFTRVDYFNLYMYRFIRVGNEVQSQ